MKSTFFINNEINNIIKKDLEEKITNIKKCKYGYFIINKRNLNEINIINNHSEWFDLYIAFNHQMVDPVVIKSLSMLEDFSWDEEVLLSSKLSLPKVMRHAQEYHINSGHTFILHDYRNNLVLLSLFNDASGEKEIDVTPVREKIFSLFVQTHQKLLSLYEIQAEKPKKMSIGMTHKENNTLYWASTGKTYKQISAIMAIQESTVKFHMGNIVKKLGAVNARHAIRLASDLKLIVLPADGHNE